MTTSRRPPERPWIKDAPADPAQSARQAFLAASTWPDEIKDDPRFYDDTQRGGRPTRPLPGFPDMGHHTNWHYTNVPLTFVDRGQSLHLFWDDLLGSNEGLG